MKSIELQGNKGGDYIKIRQTKAQEKIDCFDIEIGCSCVVTLRAQVPVEFLTILISNFGKTGELSKDIEDELFTYESRDFIKERLSRIKEYDFWGMEVADP